MKAASRSLSHKIALFAAACTLLMYPIGASSVSTPEAYAQSGPGPDWNEYSNFYMGVELQYPSDWFRDGEFLEYMFDMTFLSELENDDDEYNERLILVVEKVPSDFSLSEYEEGLIDTLREESEFSIVGSGTQGTLAGYAARSITYTSYAQLDDLNLKSKVVWTVVEDRAYVLHAYAQREKYDDYVDTFDAIVSTFKITDTSPDEPTPSYTAFTASGDLFRIDRPYTWYVASLQEELPTDDSVVAFYSPWHGYVFDGGVIHITRIDGLASGTTLQRYSEETLDGLRELEDFELIDSSEFEFSGQPARQITYTWRMGDDIIRAAEVWALVGSNAYHMSASVEDVIFEGYTPVFSRAVESFEFLGGAGAGSVEDGPGDSGEQEYLQYESSDYGISMKYPSEWLKLEPEEFAVIFTAPGDFGGDLYYENVIVGVTDSPIKLSMDEYTKLNIASMRSELEDPVVLESKSATLGGHSAHQVVMTGTLEIDVKMFAIWTMVENRQFFLLFSSEEDRYDEYTDVLMAMISSFEIDETKLETGYILYSSKELGMKAQYPANWQITETPEDGKPTAVTFSDKSQYRYFSMGLQRTLLAVSLEEFSTTITEGLAKDSDSFRLVESTPAELSGYPAHKIVYTMFLDVPQGATPDIQPVSYVSSESSVQVKSAIYVTQVNGIAYTASFGTTATGYLDFIGTANRMLDSVVINAEDVTEKISARYSDPASSLSFEVPTGWTGYHSTIGNVTAVGLLGEIQSRPDLDGSMIWILVENLTSVLERSENESGDEGNCTPYRDSYLVQATAELQMTWYSMECNFYGMEVISKSYSLYTTKDVISVTLFAEDRDSFDRAIPELEKVIKSMEAEKAINAFNSDRYDHLFGITSLNQTVSARNTTQTVHFSTKSNITDILFDESNKTLSFKVDGKTGSSGFVSVEVSDILEGPYAVTVDGVATEDFHLSHNEIDDKVSVYVNYKHSVHDIAITGATVVPEFPAAGLVLLLAGSAISLSVIYGRKLQN